MLHQEKWVMLRHTTCSGVTCRVEDGVGGRMPVVSGANGNEECGCKVSSVPAWRRVRLEVSVNRVAWTWAKWSEMQLSLDKYCYIEYSLDNSLFDAKHRTQNSDEQCRGVLPLASECELSQRLSPNCNRLAASLDTFISGSIADKLIRVIYKPVVTCGWFRLVIACEWPGGLMR